MPIIAQKQAQNEAVLPLALCKKPQYQTFLRKFKEGDDPTKMKMLGSATLVPLTNMQGDVPGGDSPYGTVVQGENVGPEMKVTGPVDMHILASRETVRRPPVVVVPPVVAAPPVVAVPSGARKGRGKAGKNGAAVLVNAAALQELQTPPPQPMPSATIELRGPFGKARLICRAVERHANMLVLVQELDANSFEPPASDQPCDLACEESTGSWTARVFPVGMAFPIASLGVFIQVFMLEP